MASAFGFDFNQNFDPLGEFRIVRIFFDEFFALFLKIFSLILIRDVVSRVRVSSVDRRSLSSRNLINFHYLLQRCMPGTLF